MTTAGPPLVVLVGPPGAGKTTVGRAVAAGARRRLPRHRRRRRRSDRPQRLGPLPARGRGRVPPARGSRPWPRRWPSTTACWRWAGERCSQRRRASCWPATRSSSSTSAWPMPSTGSAWPATGRCCWATRAASCSPCSTSAGPIYESVAKATVVDRRPHRRRGRRRRAGGPRMSCQSLGTTVIPVTGPHPYDVLVGNGLLDSVAGILGQPCRVTVVHQPVMTDLAADVVDRLAWRRASTRRPTSCRTARRPRRSASRRPAGTRWVLAR